MVSSEVGIILLDVPAYAATGLGHALPIEDRDSATAARIAEHPALEPAEVRIIVLSPNDSDEIHASVLIFLMTVYAPSIERGSR